MRRSAQKIAAPLTRRQLHTTRPPTPRPQRCFHQSTYSALPRRRDFFTSNHLLASSGGKVDGTDVSEEGGYVQRATPSAVKRKPARISAVKKNLRATSMAKKSQRGEVKSPVAQAAEDDSNYTHTIRAINVAQSFDMELVEESLRGHGFAIDPDNAGLDSNAVVHARSYNNGDIFVFSSGTVVSWSVPADSVTHIATKQLLNAANLPHIEDLEFEDLDFAADETRDNSFIRGEEVVLGTRDQSDEGRLDQTMAKIAFSMGLARSTKLAVLENKLNEFLETARPVARTLAGGSELSQDHKTVLKYLGEILGLRSQLNHYSELTDDLPDIFWDKESKIENYYNGISRILDVNPRIRQLNARIDYAYETVSVMREMSSEKRGHRLEWIIIVLISVEVLFELRRIYREEFQEHSDEKNVKVA
ncbi:hypothetical protein BKA67DRAFT_659914 [Truncatella angustata]|uniref:DUF155 domain-containing protein n=1 Tax=Truncatella angustata TaxID=152316 RepID=A0A9P8ZWQ9_9PEZI|nr:uncharacterized protein BKA67DRAFT_659914 [Truncatella angustata]KAH6653281.1 hypothetical protein BKA67DRAFT_659914 [Truncatella angustata]KAH8197771.1 hypothetical protein TruAng_008060 [Truncatella angustata]